MRLKHVICGRTATTFNARIAPLESAAAAEDKMYRHRWRNRGNVTRHGAQV